MTNPPTNKFSPEVRWRAVRMVLAQEGEHPSRWSAVQSIGRQDRLFAAYAARLGEGG